MDAILTDGQGRLWVRSYIMPDDMLQRWSVWDGSREVLHLQLGMDLKLLDARGDLLLLMTEDNLGVHQAMGEPPELRIQRARPLILQSAR